MNDEKLLTEIATKQASVKKPATQKLGGILDEFIDKKLKQRYNVYAELIDLWEQLLPSELRGCYFIRDLSSGQLTVQAKSSAHRYRLQLLSSKILSEIQTYCPRLRLKEIKVTIG